MTHKMMALRDFRGRDGEGTTLSKDRRFVEAGAEFTPTDEKRANWLETMGLAIPVTKQTDTSAARPATVKNEAADTGPLASPGGKTGEAEQPSSSPQVPAPATSTSKPAATKPITSRSMKATASPRGQKRSTPATVRGGGKKAGSPRSKG
jgi:hypothetical protein